MATIYRANGELVRFLRLGRGLTIEVAADRACMTSRHWQNIEAGRNASLAYLEQVAKVLNIKVALIKLDKTHGLNSEIAKFGHSRIGSGVIEVPLVSLRPFTCELLYGLLIRFDNSGEFATALALAEALVMIVGNNRQRNMARVRRAAILGHLGRNQASLEDLLGLEQEILPDIDEDDKEELGWVRYQIGVQLIALGRIAEAEEVLKNLIDGYGGQTRATSARHQLGVIEIGRGNYDDAIAYFNQCLKDRSPSSYRRAFEHRRIGEALILDGRSSMPSDGPAELAMQKVERGIKNLETALNIAKQAGFERYVTEILKMAEQLSVTLKGGPN